MIEIKPKCDAAVQLLEAGINVYFTRIPDAEVVNEIYSLEKQPTIKVEDPDINFGLATASCTKKEERNRFRYWISIPPVFDIAEVGNAIAEVLRTDHNLTVELIDLRPPEDGPKNTLVAARR